MYSLLIIDDEKWVRQGLRWTIDWEKEGIEVAGEAEDGESALQLIDRHAPDLIITDIKMPGLDGLSLIEEIRKRNLRTKIIIISGYSDFGYAQKALRYGANDYILKPIEESDLLEIVRKCVAELDRESNANLTLERMSDSIREGLPLARGRFLEYCLTGKHDFSLRDIHATWVALGIPVHSERLNVLSVKIHDWGKRGNGGKDGAVIRYALGNMAEEIGGKQGRGAIACPLADHMESDVAILYANADDLPLSRKWSVLIEAAERFLGIRISIGVSLPRDKTQLARSFEEALFAGAHAFFDGDGKVYDIADLPRNGADAAGYSGPGSFWETRLINAMKLGDEQALEPLLDELADHLAASRKHIPALTIYRGLISLLGNVAQKWEACFPQLPKLHIPPSVLPHFKNDLLRSLTATCRKLKEQGNRSRVIELALSYIQEHFSEGITMNDVAEHLYLNPSYFSKIFHAEVGETFSKYLVRLRMLKAKELLKDTHLKIYEVAEKVGYSDFRHFVKTFKEMEGITPAQYRELGI